MSDEFESDIEGSEGWNGNWDLLIFSAGIFMSFTDQWEWDFFKRHWEWGGNLNIETGI